MKIFKKTARTLLKPDVCSEYSAFELFRALYCTSSKLSKSVLAESKEIKPNLNLYDEISEIQNSIGHLTAAWTLSGVEEQKAIGYIDEIRAADFTIFEMAEVAHEFIAAYLGCHKRDAGLKKNIDFLNFILSIEEPIGKEEAADICRIIGMCSSAYFEKVKIGGDPMT